jgi:hypothetical protein
MVFVAKQFSSSPQAYIPFLVFPILQGSLDHVYECIRRANLDQIFGFELFQEYILRLDPVSLC